MKKYIFMLVLLAFAGSLQADDTEIYLGNANNNTVKPNIVFIFDTSGSMGESVTRDGKCLEETGYWTGKGKKRRWVSTGTIEVDCKIDTGETRLEVTKRAAIDTINDLSGVNLALMQFNRHHQSYGHGGFLNLPMKSVDDSTHKSNLISTINSLPANANTPMVESVHEAYKYYRGDDVKYGKKWERYCSYYSCWYEETEVLHHSETYTGSLDNAKFNSPITDSCQKNHIVLFTDGQSTQDTDSDASIINYRNAKFSLSDLAKIDGFMKTEELSNGNLKNSCSTTGSSSDRSCLIDLAYTMNNTDASSSVDGMQNVTFHAIGGFIGGNTQLTLDRAAMLGGGVSANAQDYSELKQSLESLFDSISQSAGTFAAPAVSVNAFNSLEQLDQMYYSVFKPHASVGWSGNVKRFRMDGSKIVDVNDNDAIDAESGFFSATAQSFWTPDSLAPDGDNVTKGGMASRFQDDRKVVSNIVDGNLMTSDNRIITSNKKITRALMGTTLTDASFTGPDIDPDINSGYTDPFDTNEFTKLVQWVGGQDSKFDATKSRKTMEDPLHSTPVFLNYGELTIDGTKVPDSTLFIGTNSGYLHAFDTSQNSPLERFAFIPKELLPVATKYYENAGQKKYGLDGYISVWHVDTNKDMIINNSEKAYLYVGMRRGGSSYYALDVSDRNNPKLLWQINGKNHQSGPTTGFEELGQSWSKMLPVDVKWNGVKTKVLLFAGGYDITEDTRLTRTTHTVGNAIYMVDAKTGGLLWKASPNANAHLKLSGMTSAITGNIVAVDDNSDGYADLLYVADLGGRIWRIDFDQEETNAKNYATGGMIADLGKDNSQGEHVRFYDSLDVIYSKAFSVVKRTGSKTTVVNNVPRYVLSIGSGYRAHPLDNAAKDNFYVVFDYNTEGPAKDASNKPNYTSVKKVDLQKYKFDATGNLDMTSTETSNNGFYVELIGTNAGEKVLSSSLTLDNTIYFTSFRPSTGVAVSSCTSDTGQSRLYRISMKPGNNSEGAVEDIKIPGIPPNPVLIIPKKEKNPDGTTKEPNPKLLISTQIFDTEDPKFPLKKTYWRELE